MKRKAFTLIELLVVIAIIAILSAILFPVFARARENARRATCMSNLKQIGLGMMMYTQDYDEHMALWDYSLPLPWPSEYPYDPYTTQFIWYDALYPYTNNWQLFNCPSENTAQNFTGIYNSVMGYAFNYQAPYAGVLCGSNCGYNLSGLSLTAIEAPSQMLGFVDSASQIITLQTAANNMPDAWPTESQVITNNACNYAKIDCVRARHLNTVNVLFMDGHVKSLQWQNLLSDAGLHYWTTTASPVPAS